MDRNKILALRSATYGDNDPLLPNGATARFIDKGVFACLIDAALLAFGMLAVLAEQSGMTFEELRSEALARTTRDTSEPN
jgi:hypothetical protein